MVIGPRGGRGNCEIRSTYGKCDTCDHGFATPSAASTITVRVTSVAALPADVADVVLDRVGPSYVGVEVVTCDCYFICDVAIGVVRSGCASVSVDFAQSESSEKPGQAM